MNMHFSFLHVLILLLFVIAYTCNNHKERCHPVQGHICGKMGIAVVSLPCDPRAPMLRQPEEGVWGKVMSVIVTGCPCKQLQALLHHQKPKAVVISTVSTFGIDDTQRLVDIATRHCTNVSIVGSFYRAAVTGATLPIYINSNATSFTLVDTPSEGSMRHTKIVLFGDLGNMRLLSVGVKSHVFISGILPAAAEVHVTSRSLVVNGHKMPVTNDTKDGTNEIYNFSNTRIASPPPCNN